MNERIAIIGAGIGGLTLAAALQRTGHRVKIFEKAPKLGEVGSGVGLWSNAIACLNTIGIEETFWKKFGCEVHSAEIAEPGGKVLSRCDVRPLTEKIGHGAYVVHRADLHRALLGKVDPDSISTGLSCTGLNQQKDGKVRLDLSDGLERRFDMVIGCDGLHSAVRASLFGRIHPVYSGQTCYRGVANLNLKERHILREVQGRGIRCAVIPLDDERVYWWAVESAQEGGHHADPSVQRAHLLALFSGWSFGLPEALEATPAESILRNDLYDRPPLKNWSRGAVTLLGDAAHPTTPNLGQGACMAIEDAYTLSHLLTRYEISGHREAFSAYENLRKHRCNRIVSESRRFGWIGGWRSRAAVSLREMILAATPEALVKRSLEKHISWESP
ncbi:MAG: FAD-dependent monooxygenase [Verrucomicrobiales bacterium]|nr:FAD-dependent monooxygenase [Verrucomicrobiales bacterium]